MARILILGGAGFIGYHLAVRLLENAGHRITLVDNLSRGELDHELNGLLNNSTRLELIAGDLTRPDAFNSLGGPFDQIYLLAGVVGVGNVQADPVKVLHTNTTIILNALEWIKEIGCGRLLFSSSSETYAGAVELGLVDLPTAETAPVAVVDIQHPRSTYAVSKIFGEAAVTHYASQFGFEAVIVRYHNIYGPRMGFSHVIPELIERIRQRVDPLPVYGLEQTRAFCYVADAVEASVSLMNCKLDGCELVHVGNDQEEISIRELLVKMLAIAGFHPEIQDLPAPPGSISRRCPSITKLAALTGFAPQIDIDHGLGLTFEWYRRAAGSTATAVVPQC